MISCLGLSFDKRKLQMSKERENKNSRPLLIWLAAGWAILRAGIPLFGLYGSFQSYSRFSYIGENIFAHKPANYPPLSFTRWAISSYGIDTFIQSMLLFVVFLAVAIAIIYASKLGLFGFLIASAGVFIWRLLILFNPVGGDIAPILSSLAALLIAIWLFRQPKVLAYFRTNLSLNFLQFRKIPIDLVLGVITFLVILFEYFYELLSTLYLYYRF